MLSDPTVDPLVDRRDDGMTGVVFSMPESRGNDHSEQIERRGQRDREAQNQGTMSVLSTHDMPDHDDPETR